MKNLSNNFYYLDHLDGTYQFGIIMAHEKAHSPD